MGRYLSVSIDKTESRIRISIHNGGESFSSFFWFTVEEAEKIREQLGFVLQDMETKNATL